MYAKLGASSRAGSPPPTSPRTTGARRRPPPWPPSGPATPARTAMSSKSRSRWTRACSGRSPLTCVHPGQGRQGRLRPAASFPGPARRRAAQPPRRACPARATILARDGDLARPGPDRSSPDRPTWPARSSASSAPPPPRAAAACGARAIRQRARSGHRARAGARAPARRAPRRRLRAGGARARPPAPKAAPPVRDLDRPRRRARRDHRAGRPATAGRRPSTRAPARSSPWPAWPSPPSSPRARRSRSSPRPARSAGATWSSRGLRSPSRPRRCSRATKLSNANGESCGGTLRAVVRQLVQLGLRPARRQGRAEQARGHGGALRLQPARRGSRARPRARSRRPRRSATTSPSARRRSARAGSRPRRCRWRSSPAPSPRRPAPASRRSSSPTADAALRRASSAIAPHACAAHGRPWSTTARAPRPRSPGVHVAGKTGTAELPGHGAARHRDTVTTPRPPTEQTDAWFVAFAPADSPRIAVGMLLVQAGGGGAVAAPAVQADPHRGLTRK